MINVWCNYVDHPWVEDFDLILQCCHFILPPVSTCSLLTVGFIFILEIFIKCPLCAWHRFLISIFIRNLSCVVCLSSSSNSAEHTTQISMAPGGNHWLVSRCLASLPRVIFFSPLERKNWWNKGKKEAGFLPCSALPFPQRQNFNDVSRFLGAILSPTAFQGVHAGSRGGHN